MMLVDPLGSVAVSRELVRRLEFRFFSNNLTGLAVLFTVVYDSNKLS